MIKYNNNTINDWNFDTSNVIKVYRNNAIVFYKFSGGSPTPEWKVCFAVVDDISQYTDREFEDVYDNATEKWYKLNNLNQYEQYGIYGSGRTSCEGSSRLPQGYTEVEYIERNSAHNGYLPLGEYFTENTVIDIDFEMTQAKGNAIIGDYGSNDNDDWRVFLNYDLQVNNLLVYDFINSRNSYDTGDWSKRFHLEIGNYYIKDLNTDTYLVNATRKTSFTRPNQMYLFHMEGSQNTNNIDYGYIYSVKIYQNNKLVRDFVPCVRDNDSMVGMYDLINDVFYYPPNNGTLVAGEPITPTDCVTTYNGKLTIDNGYEYEWNGSSWTNLGEVSGSSRVPIGYTEVEYVQNTGTSYLNIDFNPNTNTRILTEMQAVSLAEYPRLFGSGAWNAAASINLAYQDSGGYKCLFVSWYGKTDWSYNTSFTFDYDKHTYDLNKNYLYRDETLVGSTSYTTSYQSTDNLGVFTYISGGRPSSSSYWGQEHFKGRMFSFKVYDNETLVRDLVPCIRDNDDTVGAYDIVNDVFYTVPTGYTTDKLIAGAETGSTEYPKYYSDKSDPLNDLTFNTLAEAQTYAYNNCVYDGMKATIDGDRYYFDSEDENGWVKILEYYKFEDVTPNAASGWTISGSSTYNPDSSYYDDFDLETTSTSNVTKIAKVTIYGYDHFTYYLRTSGYSNYCYTVATNVDEIQTPPSTMSYNSSSAIAHTYSWNKSPKSDVNLSNYRRVTYNNLDKTVEHTFYVYFYGRKYSSYVGNATILIPKEQTNENWEQVTFSASSNVASAKKGLYYYDNNSINVDTTYWYYRWIVGLPSGSYSSYTNYSDFSYCPNTTSSTFTSVAGEQRQVNFTYDNTSNKTLSFRLTDGSNVLTPSDTVIYSMTYYNNCNISSGVTNTTFPRSQSVKIGGSFSFSNSTNRHYIYGYQPPTLGTRYYVDNYQSTFDITYTKLNDEAVTITYTTYDPSDTEVPSFNTDITYPYNGGTTSSTTLTSFDVPYTYPYTVKQTNDKFSADSQSYTANQAARTINFVLYPNNREFATVSDLEAYAYAWEGMTAYVGSDKYVYQNGEWVYNPSRLPQGYTEVEYIENVTPNKAYIDTSFKPNQNTKVIADFQYVTTNKHPRCFGCGPYNGLAYELNAENGITSNGVWNWKFGQTSGWLTTGVHTDFNRHTAIIDSGKLYLDGTVIGSTTVTTFQLSDNIGLFGFIQNGSQGGTSSGEYMFGKFYSFQIYDNGTLVRDLVPCTRDSDSKAGMYDIVNDVFYSSANSYNFVAGNPI